MENASFIFAAFAIVWAVVFGYVFVSLNRQRQLRREIDLLKETLKEEERES
ncbi:CcmD family protein [Chloroflexota bacterium]